MNEKRFTLDYEDVDYIGIDEWENGENIKSYDIYNGKFKEVDLMSIVNRMNELSEENEQLKSEKEHYKKQVDELDGLLNKFEVTFEELEDILYMKRSRLDD